MSNDKLNVTVTYPAARQPFQDHDASPTETLGSLKARVLQAFGLTEGTSQDGTVTTFTFFEGKDALEDLNRTLGAIAGHAHALALKLSQQITQGACK